MRDWNSGPPSASALPGCGWQTLVFRSQRPKVSERAFGDDESAAARPASAVRVSSNPKKLLPLRMTWILFAQSHQPPLPAPHSREPVFAHPLAALLPDAGIRRRGPPRPLHERHVAAEEAAGEGAPPYP